MSRRKLIPWWQPPEVARSSVANQDRFGVLRFWLLRRDFFPLKLIPGEVHAGDHVGSLRDISPPLVDLEPGRVPDHPEVVADLGLPGCVGVHRPHLPQLARQPVVPVWAVDPSLSIRLYWIKLRGVAL